MVSIPVNKNFWRAVIPAVISAALAALVSEPGSEKILHELDLQPDTLTKMGLETGFALSTSFGYDMLKDIPEKLKHGYNSDLEKALNRAAKTSLKNLKTIFSREATVKNIDEQFKILHEMVELPSDLEHSSIKQVFEIYLKDRLNIYPALKAASGVDWEKAGIDETLEAFILSRLEDELRKNLAEEIKVDHRAEVGYMVLVFDVLISANKNNAEILAILQSELAKQSKRQAHLLDLAIRIQAQMLEVLGYLKILGQEVRERYDEIKEKISDLKRIQELGIRLPGRLSNQPEFLFKFNNRLTTFVGREEEWDLLSEFIQGDRVRPFSIQIVTGLGGAGKSRLALELCHSFRAQGYLAGFASIDNSTQAERLGRFRPESPTLIVIDYIAARAEHILYALKCLGERQNDEYGTDAIQPDKPLRIMLLERNLGGEWWRKMQEESLIMQYTWPELMLSKLDEGNLWKIVRETYENQIQKPIPFAERIVLDDLLRIDDRQRPLFAFFVGYALAFEEDGLDSLRKWNRGSLLDRLLARESKNFWSSVEDKKYLNLLALVTLCQGITEVNRKQLFDNKTNTWWLPEKFSDEEYKKMADIENTDNHNEAAFYQGVQPDILGEYYILFHFSNCLKHDKDSGLKVINALLEVAWTVGQYYVADFLYKVLHDFEEFANEKHYKILYNTRPSVEAPEEAWVAWMFFMAIGSQTPIGKVYPLNNSSWYYNQAITGNTTQYTSGWLANCIVNYQAHICLGEPYSNDNTIRIYSLLDDLRGIVKGFPNVIVLDCYGLGLANLMHWIVKYFPYSPTREAELLDCNIEITRIYESNPINESFAHRLSMGITNILGWCARKAENITLVQSDVNSYYNSLVAVYKSYPESEEIAHRLATSTANLLGWFSQSVEYTTANETIALDCLSLVEDLRGRFIKNETIAYWQAGAIGNWFLWVVHTDKGWSTILPHVCRQYDVGRILIKEYPDNQFIAQRFSFMAWGFYLIVQKKIRNENVLFNELEMIYRDLADVAEIHKEDALVLKNYIKIFHFYIKAYLHSKSSSDLDILWINCKMQIFYSYLEIVALHDKELAGQLLGSILYSFEQHHITPP